MQTLKTFKGTEILEHGVAQDVIVQANSGLNAQLTLEAQFGKGKVLGVSEVRQNDLSADRGPATGKSADLSFGDYLAGSAGIAAFIVASYKFSLDWKWSLGIAVKARDAWFGGRSNCHHPTRQVRSGYRCSCAWRMLASCANRRNGPERDIQDHNEATITCA